MLLGSLVLYPKLHSDHLIAFQEGRNIQVTDYKLSRRKNDETSRRTDGGLQTQSPKTQPLRHISPPWIPEQSE